MKDLSVSFEFVDMVLFFRSIICDIVGVIIDVYFSGKFRIYMFYSVNGEFYGDYIEFYEDGKILYKIIYENGIRYGKFISYLENGKIIGEINYIDGKKEGKSF